MIAFADICVGFGGATLGAMAAGLTPTWGIEKRPDIAAIVSANLGGHVIVADILDVDPQTLERPDVLHASPPCPRFSLANQNRGETQEDIALGAAVARFIRVLRPRIFTLENVYLYRNSDSWFLIAAALNECGYWFDLAHLDAADFAVPQNRERMWVRAVRGQMVPHLPPAEPSRGWYQAIEDLIPGLPESRFAKWQMAAGLPPAETTLVDSAGYSNKSGQRIPVMRSANEPVNTIVANHGRRPMRAFIVDCQRGQGGTGLTIRHENQPVFAVTATQEKRPMRARLPGGRVVKMSTRCGARFQSFPDWYELSGSNTLDWYGIGNAVPPLQYQKLIAPLVAML